MNRNFKDGLSFKYLLYYYFNKSGLGINDEKILSPQIINHCDGNQKDLRKVFESGDASYFSMLDDLMIPRALW